MLHTSDASESALATSELPAAQVEPPSRSLFHIVATLLGVHRLPTSSPYDHEDRESYPPETASDLMASRYPYFYFQSLSG